MWLDIHSPHSGRIVRVRDKDVGRSVRDEDGRIFFVLARPTGEGHYASLTRTGGPREEQNYDTMLAKQATAKASGEERSTAQIHDATGRARSTLKGRLILLVIIVAVLAVAYLFTKGSLGNGRWPWESPPPTPVVPQQPVNPPPPAGGS
ncbi:MAG: hypothetical protein WD768_02180 [Phycisphaeraceae bacterium]